MTTHKFGEQSVATMPISFHRVCPVVHIGVYPSKNTSKYCRVDPCWVRSHMSFFSFSICGWLPTAKCVCMSMSVCCGRKVVTKCFGLHSCWSAYSVKVSRYGQWIKHAFNSLLRCFGVLTPSSGKWSKWSENQKLSLFRNIMWDITWRGRR